MGHVKPPYYVTSQLIAGFMDVDIRTASERLTTIRKFYNKPHGGLVSLKEYCDYEHTPLKDLEDYCIRTRGNYIPPEEGDKKKEKDKPQAIDVRPLERKKKLTK